MRVVQRARNPRPDTQRQAVNQGVLSNPSLEMDVKSRDGFEKRLSIDTTSNFTANLRDGLVHRLHVKGPDGGLAKSEFFESVRRK